MESILSKKIQLFVDIPVHWCPGCKMLHPIYVFKPTVKGHRWTWDGNVEYPTFQPSFHLIGVCHYFIRAGKIEYLHDCTHDLAGQTIDLPDIPIDEL